MTALLEHDTPVMAFTAEKGWHMLTPEDGSVVRDVVDRLDRDELDPLESDRLADEAEAIGPAVICAVHDGDRDTISELLTDRSPQQLLALVVVLAAAVDPDQPWRSALQWAHDTDWRPVQPCGTHPAFVRHVNAGEEPDVACRRGERLYQRDHKRIARARAAAVAS